MDPIETLEIVKALRRSSKGQLKYDRNWHEEGRTEEILDEITKKFSTLTLSPQALEIIVKGCFTNGETKCANEPVNDAPVEVKKDESKEKLNEEIHKTSEDVHFFKQLSETELPIIQYETERLKSVRQLFDVKIKEFEQFSGSLQKQVEQQYHIERQRQEIQALQKNFELQSIEQTCFKEYEASYKKPPVKNGSHQDSQLQVHSQMSDSRKDQIQMEKEALMKKNKEQEELKLKYENLHESLSCDIFPKIQEKIHYCEQKKFPDLPYVEWKSLTSSFTQALEMISGSLTSNMVTLSDLYKCQMLWKQAERLFQDISLTLASKEAEMEQENRRREQESRNKEILSLPENAIEKPTVNNNILPETSEVDAMEEDECANQNAISSEETTAEKEKTPASEYIDVSAYQVYYNVMKTMKELDIALESFRNDPKQKKYRLMLHKAVAINTISDASGSQLRDKVRSLVSLLSGQTIECGGKCISANEHQLAISYCKNLLAEKIVMQGEDQVGSKTAAAFPFACVAVTICSKFPDVEQLIMGHFYMKCPYLVPFYPAKEEGMSDDDYCIALGYKYTDGKIEEKTNFLKRMHGCMGLYAAMIQSQCVPGYPTQKFFTLAQGWKWIAQVLNIDPRPDITATMLLVFLEVAGHALFKSYGKQFKKVLHTLCKDYFLKIKHIESSGGPIGRLKEFLQQAIKRGSISQPEGIINSYFWRT